MPFIPLKGGVGLVAVEYFVVVELQLADGLGFGIFGTGRDVESLARINFASTRIAFRNFLSRFPLMLCSFTDDRPS